MFNNADPSSGSTSTPYHEHNRGRGGSRGGNKYRGGRGGGSGSYKAHRNQYYGGGRPGSFSSNTTSNDSGFKPYHSTASSHGPYVPRNRVALANTGSSSSSRGTSTDGSDKEMLSQQLRAMMAALGNIVYVDSSTSTAEEEEKNPGSTLSQRPDVGKQVRDLLPLFAGNPKLFLREETAQIIIHCASTLPLQTCGYVALSCSSFPTTTSSSQDTSDGTITVPTDNSAVSFTDLCVQQATLLLVQDLQQLVPASIIGGGSTTTARAITSAEAEEGKYDNDEELKFHLSQRLPTHRKAFVHCCRRILYLLRYLALVSKIGIIQIVPTTDNTTTSSPDATSMLGLLQYLVQLIVTFTSYITTAAATLQRSAYVHLCKILVYLVCSTLPYLSSSTCTTQDDSRNSIPYYCTQIFDQIRSILEQHKDLYRSSFQPGYGIQALYSFKEEYDSLDIEEEEDDQDEDEDEEGASCSDTLEELIRVISRLQSCNWESSASTTFATEQEENADDTVIISCGAPNFAVFSDAPWEGLCKTPSKISSTTQENEEGGTHILQKEPISMTHLSQLILPSLTDFDCNAEEHAEEEEEEEEDHDTFFAVGTTKVQEREKNAKKTIITKGLKDNNRQYMMQCIVLATTSSTLIHGRFPILAQDDEDEETSDTCTSTTNQMTPSDHFFFAECIREVLFAYVPTLAPSGVEYTTVHNKEHVASHLLGIFYLFSSSSSTSGKKGEDKNYLLMETLLGLVAQSSTSFMYHSPHYLGRAIVELCKLVPQSTFPAALVHGVGCIAGSECSSLVPYVRKRLAHWFGYHLFNTEFQWPYWSHWDTYSATEGTSAYSNAKTQFVAHALEYCADLSSFSCIQDKCLPRESPHLSLIRPFDTLIFQHDPRIDHPLTTELLEKVKAKEPKEVLLEWFSDEDTVARANDELEGWRTKVAIHAIIGSVVTHGREEGHGKDDTRDLFSEVLEILRTYGSVISYAIEQDSSSGGSTAAEILFQETDWLCGHISHLLTTIVFRLFVGELHLASLTSLMEFLMLQMGCSKSGRRSEPNIDITYLWDTATSCLGNYVEVGVKACLLNASKVISSCFDMDHEGAEDQVERKMRELTIDSEEHQATLSYLSKDIVTSVLYTMECIIRAAFANGRDEWTEVPVNQVKNKLSPKISRCLDGLRTFILTAQTRTLELFYYAGITVSLVNKLTGSSSAVEIAWSDLSGVKLAWTGNGIIKECEMEDTIGRQLNRSDIQLIHNFIRVLERGGGLPIA